MRTYLDAADVKKIPQSEQADPAQEKNNAGGFSFTVDKWDRLDRFLIIGTESGTYYASAREHTKQGIKCLEECLAEDSKRYVQRVVDLSTQGRAIKNDTCIFALAYAMKHGDDGARWHAHVSARSVCRIGTHWFQLAEALKVLGVGWGRGVKRMFQEKFTKSDPASVIYDVIKYQQRDGWSQRDLLRLSKPAGVEGQMKEVLHWVTKGWPSTGEAQHPDPQLSRIWGFERLKKETDPKVAAKLIAEFSLPRECVPTQLLNSTEVWAALLENGGNGMPMTALVRNLGKMTAIGLLKPLSDMGNYAHKLLIDEERISRSRIHPMTLYMATKQYALGHGDKGKLEWTPNVQLVLGMGIAFIRAFKNVQPTNKKTMLALDISGSMSTSVLANSPVSAREIVAAMAMVTARVEPNHMFTGFSDVMRPLRIHGQMDLLSIMQEMERLPFGRTDCAMPMTYAMQNDIPVEVFVIYTDNETWIGPIHPHVAMREYRRKTGIPAKLVVVGTTATEFTIADPKDKRMLDVVGFDTAAPALIADFCRD